MVATRYRGFAYEGAAMGLTMVGALRPGRRRRMGNFPQGLVLDGYGFHQACSHTQKHVHERYQDPTLIDGFAGSRRPDLDSGAGPAATYAGAADEESRVFWKRAGEYRPQAAQGSAFAAEARQRAGLETPHTRIAAEVFCGMEPEEAARIRVRTRPEGTVPADEERRRRIADEFVSKERC